MAVRSETDAGPGGRYSASMFSIEPGSRFRLAATSAAIGFLAGALVVAVTGVLWERRHPSPVPVSRDSPVIIEGAPMMVIAPEEPPPLAPDPASNLRARNLEMPVLGASRTALSPSFADARSDARKHEAIDILAPRNTPAVAVEDGTIARLLRSDAGGITVYLFDPTTTYVYYYAHLDRYAGGLVEGARVTRGQILGYVGTSGNAPVNTPHLHFAIFKLTESRKWWQGTPIDPFAVLK